MTYAANLGRRSSDLSAKPPFEVTWALFLRTPPVEKIRCVPVRTLISLTCQRLMIMQRSCKFECSPHLQKTQADFRYTCRSGWCPLHGSKVKWTIFSKYLLPWFVILRQICSCRDHRMLTAQKRRAMIHANKPSEYFDERRVRQWSSMLFECWPACTWTWLCRCPSFVVLICYLPQDTKMRLTSRFEG